MTPAELATADLRRRAWKILARMRWENPDVTAARRAEIDAELAQRARQARRRRRVEATKEERKTACDEENRGVA